jgi:hypothetical protein
MTCRAFDATLHPYIDEELSADTMSAADCHVAVSTDCLDLVRPERQLRGIVRRVSWHAP